jgi:hypothetical protein
LARPVLVLAGTVEDGKSLVNVEFGRNPEKLLVVMNAVASPTWRGNLPTQGMRDFMKDNKLVVVGRVIVAYRYLDLSLLSETSPYESIRLSAPEPTDLPIRTKMLGEDVLGPLGSGRLRNHTVAHGSALS